MCLPDADSREISSQNMPQTVNPNASQDEQIGIGTKNRPVTQCAECNLPQLADPSVLHVNNAQQDLLL